MIAVAAKYRTTAGRSFAKGAEVARHAYPLPLGGYFSFKYL